MENSSALVDRTETESVDWWAASQVAQTLGSATRRLVALQDTDEAIRWALRMSREHSGVAALSYIELAVALGWRDEENTVGARLEWNDLLRAVEKLQAIVKVKADEEKRAAEAAAAAAKAAAEKEAAERAAAADAERAAAEEEAERLADEDGLDADPDDDEWEAA